MGKMDMRLRKTWDLHAEEELTSASVPNLREVTESKDFIYSWLRQIKKKPGAKKLKLLDEGCGIGQYVTGARLLGFQAEGLDISPISVKIGRERGEKIIVGDMRKMPYKNESFDIVIAGGSMEHFPETDLGLREANRVLKKGGEFLINVPYRYTIYVITKILQQTLGLWTSGYEKSFSKSDFINKLQKNGFKILEVRKTRIGGGTRFPVLVKILKAIDGPFYKLGFGGHHIWFKCIKI